MPALQTFALCAVFLSPAVLIRADDAKTSDRSTSESSSKPKDAEKRPVYAKLLVGKWVRTDGQYAGTVVVYDKNGTHTTTSVTKINGKPVVMSGSWKLDGEKVVQTLGQGRNLTDTTVNVVGLTETEFRFKNKAGQEATYERVVEDGEQGTGEKKGKK